MFSSKSNHKWLLNLSIPSCSWADWQKTQYPCKDFAVFPTYEKWDLIPCQSTTETEFFITLTTEHLAINNPPASFTTTEDTFIPDAQHTNQHVHGKSRDESSSDQEMETGGVQQTYTEASELQTLKPKSKIGCLAAEV